MAPNRTPAPATGAGLGCKMESENCPQQSCRKCASINFRAHFIPVNYSIRTCKSVCSQGPRELGGQGFCLTNSFPWVHYCSHSWVRSYRTRNSRKATPSHTEGEAALNASCPGMAEEILVPFCWGCAERRGQEPRAEAGGDEQGLCLASASLPWGSGVPRGWVRTAPPGRGWGWRGAARPQVQGSACGSSCWQCPGKAACVDTTAVAVQLGEGLRSLLGHQSPPEPASPGLCVPGGDLQPLRGQRVGQMGHRYQILDALRPPEISHKQPLF